MPLREWNGLVVESTDDRSRILVARAIRHTRQLDFDLAVH